jgi:hypothetical protein
VLLFITRRLRQWLLLAIAVPLLSVGVHLLREALERRSGETSLTRALRRLEDLGQRARRGGRRDRRARGR